MTNVVLSWLSRDWAGLLVAALLLAVALLLFAAAVPPIVWVPPAALAAAAAAGAGVHLAQVRRALRRHPAPGRMVDVGGYRMHVLAEGDAGGRPPVVWLPGSHAGGLALAHLHRRLREDGRSILVDRPGAGWSDPGPFPRTTRREVDEVLRALERAGEQGPFLFAGHSFGGFLAAAIARRHPDRVAGLVLLDATPPETIAFGPPNPLLARMRRDAVWSAIVRLFGFRASAAERRQKADPALAPVLAAIRDALGDDVNGAIEALGLRTREQCAAASIFAELSPHGMASIAWDVIAYDGDLGDLPIFLVAPGDNEAERAMMRAIMAGDSPEQARMLRFYAATRERYLAASSRAERIHAPAGTGHNFPCEAPDFTAATVRAIRDRLGAGA